MVVAVLISTSGLCLGWQGKGPKRSFHFKDRLGEQRTQEMTRVRGMEPGTSHKLRYIHNFYSRFKLMILRDLFPRKGPLRPVT